MNRAVIADPERGQASAGRVAAFGIEDLKGILSTKFLKQNDKSFNELHPDLLANRSSYK